MTKGGGAVRVIVPPTVVKSHLTAATMILPHDATVRAGSSSATPAAPA